MTDTNTPTHLPTTPDYQFAYVLATIHSTFLIGDMERVYRLLENLPLALMDPDVRDIYNSDEVTQYLEWVYPILFNGEEEKGTDAEEEFDVTKFIQELLDTIIAEESDEAEGSDDSFGCDDPECICHDLSDEGDWEEVIAETDEFIIVKIKK